MLLSDEEIGEIAEKAFADYMNDKNDDVDLAMSRAIEAAILAKLAAKDFPEPVGAYELVVGQEEWQGCPSEIIEMRDAYSAAQLHEAHAQGFAAGAAAQLSAEPVAVMHRGELCIKSTDDDQSFGMLCPTTISEGTELYTRREA